MAVFIDASGTRLAYVAEVTEGTTPATPAFKILRVTGETLRYKKESARSDELRADRNVADNTVVGFSADGGFNTEWTYGSYDDLLEGVMFSTWATDVLVNGTTRKPMTFEKKFDGTTDPIERFPGCLVGGLSLNLDAQKIMKASWKVMGRDGISTITPITGATYAAVNDNPVLNTSSHFSNLAITGVAGVRIKAMTIDIDNNLRPQPIVGQAALAGIAAGRFVVSGKISAYFESVALLDAIVADTELGVSFDVGATTGEKYTFNIPRIKVVTGDPVATGNDTDVMIEAEYQALYDPGIVGTIEITRAVA